MTREETVKAKYGEDYYIRTGKKGGKVKVKKGIAALSPEKRKELSAKAHEARWGKKEKS